MHVIVKNCITQTRKRTMRLRLKVSSVNPNKWFFVSFFQLKLGQIFCHLYPDGWWFTYELASFESSICFCWAERLVSFDSLQRTITVEEAFCCFSQNYYSHKELSDPSWTSLGKWWSLLVFLFEFFTHWLFIPPIAAIINQLSSILMGFYVDSWPRLRQIKGHDKISFLLFLFGFSWFRDHDLRTINLWI